MYRWYSSGVPRPRFFRLPERERLELLRLAAEEFAREGFFGASYNRIIEQSALGKSSVYLAFDDKEDLFFTVVRHRLPAFDGTRPEGIAGKARFWPTVAEWLGAFVQHAVRDPLVVPLVATFYELLPTSTRGVALEREIHDFIVRFIVRGRELGVVRTDLASETLAALALGCLMTVDKLAVSHLRSPVAGAGEDLTQWIDLAVDTLRRIASPSEPPKRRRKS